MNNIQVQNVSTTAISMDSLRETETSYIRTNNPYFEKIIWLITRLGSQSVSKYLDDISHSMSASVIGSLADEIQVRKTTFAPEVALALYYVKAISEYITEKPGSSAWGGFSAFLLHDITQKSRWYPISDRSSSMLITALRRLDELQNLPQDWDSYDADPISQNAIATAKSIIISVMKSFGNTIGDVVQLTDVIPIADGGVQLEWVGPHAELEIEISPNSNIGLLYISGSGDKRNYEESEDNSINAVYAMIARLIHSQYNN